MSTDKEQIKFNYDHSVYLLGEIKSDMKIINTRSIWLLGILALITLGLADFLFRDFGTPTNIVGNIDDRFIKVYSALLLIHDFALIIIFIPKLLWGIEVPRHNEYSKVGSFNEIAETEKLLTEIQKNAKKLYNIDTQFKILIFLFTTSPAYLYAIAAFSPI